MYVYAHLCVFVHIKVKLSQWLTNQYVTKICAGVKVQLFDVVNLGATLGSNMEWGLDIYVMQTELFSSLLKYR